jgi:MFS family permease
MTPRSRRKGLRADERPGESEAERLDRNYGELLQEMRVLQAGVQILFAFLLTLAFQSSFAKTTDFQRNAYLVSLVTATLAAACIIGPVPFHRLLFRRGMKADLIMATTRYVAAGLVSLFIAMVGAVLLVLDVLLSRWLACVVAGGLASVFVVLWLVVPVVVRARESDSAQDKPGA